LVPPPVEIIFPHDPLTPDFDARYFAGGHHFAHGVGMTLGFRRGFVNV